jgi:nucleoside-diphosphate-sugar epimerase
LDGLRHVMAAIDAGSLTRVLFVSSSAVYGERGGGWVDEDTAPDPPGFNGTVLLQAERWLAAQPVTGIALRLAGLYGPGRLQLIDRLRAAQARVPRTQVHWANRIHIDDAAAAVVHLLALPAPKPVYVGADDTPLPIDQLYGHLAKLAGAPPPGEGPAPAGIGSKRLCNARLRATGWSPQWPDARQGYAALLASSAPPD